MKQISIRLDEKLLAAIDAEAERLGVSRNLVISRRVGKLPPLYQINKDTGEISVVRETEPAKKIAEEPVGEAAQGGGGTPDLSRSGKAQERIPVVYKPRSKGITDLVVGEGDTCDIPDAAKEKPDMASLREIAAGNIPVPNKISAEQDTSKYGADICGFKSYNEEDGENYICGMAKHGPKVKHGGWIKA